MHKVPDKAGLVDRVRTLLPLVAENADEAERQRKPVDEVMAAICDAGVFHAHVPARYGGYEIDPDPFIDIGLMISKACTSTGWVTSFCMEHNWMLAQFPPEAQEAIFGNQPYIIAPGSISPTGKADRVEGGFRLNGRWAWGTGVMHADWALLNGLVDGKEPRLFIVPMSEVQVEDTWYAAGMEGTGSNDMVATDIFVAESHSQTLASMSLGRGSGALWHDAPCFKHPMLPLLTIAAATPSVAAAYRAIELFIERLNKRTLYGTRSPQAERQTAQVLLGNAMVQTKIAEQNLRHIARRLNHWSHTEEICPPDERAELRLLGAQTVQSCRDVVQNIMSRSGASAHLRSQPMQRLLRDINTMSAHTVFDTDLGGENYGRILLGMEPVSPV